ncbi:hypothetical protein EV360DRAFT_69326 [Lentinula raphanica]|nr:hypothetical protein EV360DRAFT_69326 [Lentinula raphanica]
MPSSRVPCVNPARLLFIFLLLLTASFRVIAAPAPMESAGKTQMKVAPLWDNTRDVEAKLFFRRHTHPKTGKKRLVVVGSEERVLRPDEEMLFTLHEFVKLTPTEVASDIEDEWRIKQEWSKVTGSMLYLGLVNVKKYESVELLKAIDALPPSSTSIDAMNRVVEFLLSSPRWKLQPHKPNLRRWKELVEAKRDPLYYKGTEWNVDELKKAPEDHNESGPSPQPANLQLPAPGSLAYILNEEPIEDSKKESHKSYCFLLDIFVLVVMIWLVDLTLNRCSPPSSSAVYKFKAIAVIGGSFEVIWMKGRFLTNWANTVCRNDFLNPSVSRMNDKQEYQVDHEDGHR